MKFRIWTGMFLVAQKTNNESKNKLFIGNSVD